MDCCFGVNTDSSFAGYVSILHCNPHKVLGVGSDELSVHVRCQCRVVFVIPQQAFLMQTVHALAI
jgi:hypothetical protein